MSAGDAPLMRVPAGGLPAWTTTDATATPVARLDPWLEVEVVERWGDWAEIRCSNGWMAWVDGRFLEPIGPSVPAPGPVPGPVPDAPQAPPTPSSPHAAGALPSWIPQGVARRLGWQRQVVIGGRSVGVGVSAIGAVMVFVGSFFSWFTLPGYSIDSFDVPVKYLLDTNASRSGPDLGLVLLAAAIGSVLSMLRPGHERHRRWVALASVAIPVVYAVQVHRQFAQVPEPDRPGLTDLLGLGVYVTLVGALLMLVPTPEVAP